MEPISNEIEQYLSQANLARLRQQWDEAIDGCVEVLRKEPGNAPAHSLLGDIYRDKGKLEDAAQWYQMAVDLHTSPSDTEKLKQTEAEILRRSAHKTVSIVRTSSLDAEGAISGGTMPLMGVQPRKWLRVMTISSLSFLGLMFILLAIIKISGDSGQRSVQSGRTNRSILPEAQISNVLPPINPRGSIVLPPGEATRDKGQSATGGSGFTPDIPPPGRTLPGAPPADQNASAPPSRPHIDNSRETPPASVRSIRPAMTSPSDIPLNPPPTQPYDQRNTQGTSISIGDEKLPELSLDGKNADPPTAYKTTEGKSGN